MVVNYTAEFMEAELVLRSPHNKEEKNGSQAKRPWKGRHQTVGAQAGDPVDAGTVCQCFVEHCGQNVYWIYPAGR